MSQRVLQIDPADDVIVALVDLVRGDDIAVNGHRLRVTERIPAKHKFALRPLTADESVRMYGVVVGRTTVDVPAGGLLTIENLRHHAEPFTVRQGAYTWRPPDVDAFRGLTFDGYHRGDGRVGTANHWLVVPLVFCENRNVDVLRDAFVETLGYGRGTSYAAEVRRLVEAHRKGESVNFDAYAEEDVTTSPSPVSPEFPNVTGIKFLTHGGGCGGTRDDARALCALLAAYIDHPNVAGATVLSLGCQNAQAALLEDELDRRGQHEKPVITLDQQRSGTERALITEAIRRTFSGLVGANEIERAPASADNLIFGVECGGSDGFSGISANPAIGLAADMLVALGGSVVLSEFPELCGVEQGLIDRCVSIEVAERFSHLQHAYADRAAAIGVSFDMNPSPGNIRDGLLTDAMKSAGAARKGGSSPVVDVLDYTESVRRRGLNLLCSPGNDVESTTALAAAGANVILFSTGLGTPTGNPIVPVLKIASNSDLAARMPDVIDLDAGSIIGGTESVRDVAVRIVLHALRVASGEEEPAAVRLGQDDFLPWKRGISL